jgi:hypothetical protein
MKFKMICLSFSFSLCVFSQRNVQMYRGIKLPFKICYLIIHDTIAEIEFFYTKGGQIFGHIPAKKLIKTVDGSLFKSSDDSLKVYRQNKYFLVKASGHSGKIKLLPSTHDINDISELRERNKTFRSYQDSIKLNKNQLK